MSNRAQRRASKKQSAKAKKEAFERKLFEKRYAQQIQERQERIDDILVMAYTTIIGLAICDVYPDRRHRPSIKKVVAAFNQRICSINGVDVTLETLQEELKRITASRYREGIEFSFEEGEVIHIGKEPTC